MEGTEGNEINVYLFFKKNIFTIFNSLNCFVVLALTWQIAGE
jgi:hypothetical protein